MAGCGTRKAGRKANRKAEPMTGGRTMKRGKRAPSAWNKMVKRVYEDMKRKDKNATFSDALKAASKLKKAGKA
jgi:hypothetical protein